MKLSNSWKQAGNVWLWRYTRNQRNYGGWHLTADAAGCSSLVELLKAFVEDGIPALRTVKISDPTVTILSVPNKKSAWIAPSKLRISMSPVATDWLFPATTDPATLTLGGDWMDQLSQAIEGIQRNEGDYSIGQTADKNQRLWFWWRV